MKKQTYAILPLAALVIIGIGVFSISHEAESEIETVVIDGSLPNYSVEYLAKETPYAIVGTVEDIIMLPVQYDEVGIANVFTDIVIDVDKDIHQDYDQSDIKVRIQGGQTEKHHVIVEASPVFEIGKRVLVIVAEKEPDSIYGNNHYVAGLQHGKYDLEENGMAINKDPSRNMPTELLEKIIADAKIPSDEG